MEILDILLPLAALVAIGWVIGQCLVRWNNTLVSKKNKVDEFLSNINIELRKRNDMVTELVTVFSQFAIYEPETLKQVISLRGGIGTSAEEIAKLSETQLCVLAKALSERYPDLAAAKHFAQLASAIQSTEQGIAQMRKSYNAVVKSYNDSVQQFPSSWVAQRKGFKAMPYLETDDAFETLPEIKLIK